MKMLVHFDQGKLKMKMMMRMKNYGKLRVRKMKETKKMRIQRMMKMKGMMKMKMKKMAPIDKASLPHFNHCMQIKDEE